MAENDLISKDHPKVALYRLRNNIRIVNVITVVCVKIFINCYGCKMKLSMNNEENDSYER